MWKKVLVLSTAVVLAGSAAFAQQRYDGRGGDPAFGFQGPNPEDLSAFTDARVAALKAGLRLTPDQEKNWPAFEQAYRNLAKLRTDHVAPDRGQGPATNDQTMVDRLQRRADAVTQYGTALQDLAKTAQPLYQSLDDAQKRRFAALSRFLSSPRHMAMGMGMRMDRGMGMGMRHGHGYPGDRQ